MIERFSPGSKRAVALAQDESWVLQHNYTGIVHIVLGLLRAGGVAARALSSLGVTYDDYRAKVVAGYRSDNAWSCSTPLTDAVKCALNDHTLPQAALLGRSNADTEHILLAVMVSDPKDDGVEILATLGATPTAVRTAVLWAGGYPDVFCFEEVESFGEVAASDPSKAVVTTLDDVLSLIAQHYNVPPVLIEKIRVFAKHECG